MIWHIFYWSVCAISYLVAFGLLGFGWCGRAFLSLLVSATVTFMARRTRTSRSMPSRVEAALRRGDGAGIIRKLIEDEYGDRPTTKPLESASLAGLFAYIPFVMLWYTFLRVSIASTFWGVSLGMLLSVPCAVLLGAVAHRIAAEKAMCEKVLAALKTDNDVWRALTDGWTARLESEDLDETGTLARVNAIMARKTVQELESVGDFKHARYADKQARRLEMEARRTLAPQSSGMNQSNGTQARPSDKELAKELREDLLPQTVFEMASRGQDPSPAQAFNAACDVLTRKYGLSVAEIKRIAVLDPEKG